MKFPLYAFLFLTVLIAGCNPSQKVVGSWVNREALPKGPFNSIFIMAITQDEFSQLLIEDRLAKLFASRGKKVVKSNTIFPLKLMGAAGITKEQLAAAISRNGCDAFFAVSLLDVRSEEKYVPGTTYTPMNQYSYYGNYYGYYNYRYPTMYSPGYHQVDNTYFVETNFYDVKSENLLWSVQSSAYNPKELDTWFNEYSTLILQQLKKEGLITN
jgi:hypothetical protein